MAELTNLESTLGEVAGVDIVLNARVDVLGLEGDRRELFEEGVRRARL